MPKFKSIRDLNLAGKRVLISSGAQDPIVPATHPEELAQLLRAGSATVKVQTHPASHGLVAGDLRNEDGARLTTTGDLAANGANGVVNARGGTMTIASAHLGP